MAKARAISGFPEWLPEERLLEERCISRLREVFQSYGYMPIETSSAELLSTLQAKGVVEKEIYALRRLSADADSEDELALHFDLTVPFARYVALNLNELTFPFRRYQVQKVWRGERPQKGRFREFYQFDIDLVAREELPLAADSEVIMAFQDGYRVLEIGKIVYRINNRKIVLGVLEALGVAADSQKKSIIAIDKFDKIGRDGVLEDLQQEAGLSSQLANQLLDSVLLSFPLADAASELARISFQNDKIDSGKQEILKLLELLPPHRTESISVHLNLVRGLDYYTGLILEAYHPEHMNFGAIGGGGRYEDLASEFSRHKLPGVGLSIGLSRLMSLIFENGLLERPAKSVAEVFVAVFSDEQLERAFQVSDLLRRKGIRVEIALKASKMGKQLELASKKGVPFVVLMDEGKSSYQLKNMTEGSQTEYPDLEQLAIVLKDC